MAKATVMTWTHVGRPADLGAESRLEAVAVPAAQLELRAVGQANHVVARAPQIHLLDPVEIHDRRPMNAREAPSVERALECRHRLANQMRPLPRVQSRVVPECLDPVDLAGGDEVHPPL